MTHLPFANHTKGRCEKIGRGEIRLHGDARLHSYGPFDIPLEEFLFFIIVPMAAILTIEGVTTVKPHLREKEFGKDEK